MPTSDPEEGRPDRECLLSSLLERIVFPLISCANLSQVVRNLKKLRTSLRAFHRREIHN